MTALHDMVIADGDEQAEPVTRVPLLRDPPPPPGYVDPLQRSETLGTGSPGAEAPAANGEQWGSMPTHGGAKEQAG